MELKVVCNCGQKYKFDVEPVNGRMPVTIACPVCGADGTEKANGLLAQQFAVQPPPIPIVQRPAIAMAPPPPVAASASGVRVNRPPPVAHAAPAPTQMRGPAVALAAAKPASGTCNLWLGILGAALGAGLGAGLMYAFYLWADFRFPLMGTGIGVLTGLGARLLARGTDMTLGVIAGMVALLSTAGTLFLMYGDIAGLFIISMIVSVSLAYKIAS